MQPSFEARINVSTPIRLISMRVRCIEGEFSISISAAPKYLALDASRSGDEPAAYTAFILRW